MVFRFCVFSISNSEVSMRKPATLVLICLAALALSAQTAKSTTAAKPAVKSATATKSATTTPVSKYPKAIFNTTAGQITCTLFPDKAPMTVENFIGLANGTKDWKNPASGAKMQGKRYFDGTVFHRVIPDFMIQGGDPLGNGAGGPGYAFKNEYSDLRFDQPGRLAMANAGRDTNGSQFFITISSRPLTQLDGGYTIFGQCGNLDVANAIAAAPKTFGPNGEQSKPLNPVKITKLTIVKAATSTAPKVTPKAAPKTAPKAGASK
jgi:peptidyl-prolyl cis-trans isomerase A (cyclophilin A)